MKISIITTTFNSAQTIADTLKSIVQQDYPNIEHIIIDGASKDNTLEIVKQFPHVSKVISEIDKGIYDAMNKGIKAATGDIVGFLNSDDFFTHSNSVSAIVKTFQNSGADSVFGDVKFVEAKDIMKVVRYYSSLFKPSFIL